MTILEFKTQYPQYSHLEGNDLWDKMTEALLQFGEVLYADPNQEKVFHHPMDIGNGIIVTMEDSSTTRWLNSKGELVRIGEPEEPKIEIPLESYKMEIIDFSKS
jgi:hypothetical protein